MRKGGASDIYIYVVLLALSLPSIVVAQDSNPTDRETISQLVQQIRQLQQQDRELQQRIKALEEKQSPGAPAPSDESGSSPAPPSGAEPPSDQTSQSSPSTPPRDWHDIRGIQWRGFGEGDYKVLNQRQPESGDYGFVPGSAGNFYTGDFGLFLTSKLTEKTSVLGEIVFEEGDAQKYRVDLRRVLLKYDYSDHLKMSFGRYQTNIGYYNSAFRSAAWLQTTTDRPLVMEFATNGGLLPTQAIGISVTGEVPSGKLGLNYIAEYGSSDTIRPDINGDGHLTDENNGNQANVGIFVRPDALPGLQIGSSYYHDQISDNVLNAHIDTTAPPPSGSPGPAARYEQTIVNSYAVYVAHGVEFLNEGFLIRHALIGGPLHFDTPAFYSQISQRFGPVRPFFRFQYVNASPRNFVYDDVGLRFGPSFGARYDLNDYVAFKLQLDRTARRNEPDLSGLHLQLAFTF
ncbi:MAG: hypothetical protein WB729_17750 [Candidatus Sulfotelmatobacter sp.]